MTLKRKIPETEAKFFFEDIIVLNFLEIERKPNLVHKDPVENSGFQETVMETDGHGDIPWSNS